MNCTQARDVKSSDQWLCVVETRPMPVRSTLVRQLAWTVKVKLLLLCATFSDLRFVMPETAVWSL